MYILRLAPEWKNLVPAVEDGFPKLSDGSSAPVSVYLRTAYATEGLRLLIKNPLGYDLVV